eukprot:TRINITY_DN7341_c0_g1_i2.p1 TRINITY_DN7341_c0_g1~~TRINITY_DN7341_c0_g1_i2.p1  ORF type:complete len:165 (-),score=55.53 TRINITY_DN7341_c0_g1_i2:145-591(-)
MGSSHLPTSSQSAFFLLTITMVSLRVSLALALLSCLLQLLAQAETTQDPEFQINLDGTGAQEGSIEDTGVEGESSSAIVLDGSYKVGSNSTGVGPPSGPGKRRMSNRAWCPGYFYPIYSSWYCRYRCGSYGYPRYYYQSWRYRCYCCY